MGAVVLDEQGCEVVSCKGGSTLLARNVTFPCNTIIQVILLEIGKQKTEEWFGLKKRSTFTTETSSIVFSTDVLYVANQLR